MINKQILNFGISKKNIFCTLKFDFVKMSLFTYRLY